MHIGLIGGIGVAATRVYYTRLVAAIEALGGVPELTIVHARAGDLVRHSRMDDRVAQVALYLPLLQRLRDAGADCAAITSIGGHFCFKETRARSPLALVSAIAPLDAWCEGEGLARVGLLGTRVAMATRLYGSLERTEAVVLEEELGTLGSTYADMAIAGACTSAQRAYFLDAAARLVRDHGAEAVLLAGTDLGLAFDGAATEYRVVDALDIHVDVLARLGANLTPLDAVSGPP